MVRTLRRRGFAAVLAVTFLAAAFVSGPAPEAAAAQPEASPAADGEAASTIVARLRGDLEPGAATALLARLGIDDSRLLRRSGLYLIPTSSPAEAGALIEALRDTGLFDEVTRDRPARALDLPDDPDFPLQWHLRGGSGGMNAEGAWPLLPASSARITVAVIDTGVAYEDYTAPGPLGQRRFAPAPDLAGVPIVAPWNFLDGSPHADDDNGHGTHVAGIIAQTTNNGIGGAGIAPQATLMPLKALDYSGNGTGAHVVEAIYYAVDNGADVINLSLGFPGTGLPDLSGAVCGEIPGLREALSYAAEAGVVVVAAAGNEGADVVSCPAADPTVIAVGATDRAGARAWYSNRGEALDLTAPGGDLSADLDRDGHPDGILQQTYCFDWPSLLLRGDFTVFCSVRKTGTSVAAPQVAAAAALLLATDPGLSALEVRRLLEGTADDRGPEGWDPEYGHGSLDAAAAMAALLASPPLGAESDPVVAEEPHLPVTPPAGLAVEGTTATSISLSWSAGSIPGVSFRIEQSTDGLRFSLAGISPAGGTSFTARGLSPATDYWFRIQASSGSERSPYSEPVQATTSPPPAAPGGLAVLSRTATTLTLSWTDNSDTEQGFRIELAPDGEASFSSVATVLANRTSYTITGLLPASRYLVRVRAFTAGIMSPPSEVLAASTALPPAAPADLTVTALSPTSARLSWTDRSRSETAFRVERSADGSSWALIASLLPNRTGYTVRGLTPGSTCFFRVVAVERAVTSPPSNVVEVAMPPAP